MFYYYHESVEPDIWGTLVDYFQDKATHYMGQGVSVYDYNGNRISQTHEIASIDSDGWVKLFFSDRDVGLFVENKPGSLSQTEIMVPTLVNLSTKEKLFFWELVLGMKFILGSRFDYSTEGEELALITVALNNVESYFPIYREDTTSESYFFNLIECPRKGE